MWNQIYKLAAVVIIQIFNCRILTILGMEPNTRAEMDFLYKLFGAQIALIAELEIAQS